MKYVSCLTLLVFASAAWSQDAVETSGFGQTAPRVDAPGPPSLGSATTRSTLQQTVVRDPFAAKASLGGKGMRGMSFEAAEMEEDFEDMAGIGMEMMGGAMGPSRDQVFRQGVQRAIDLLKKSKTDDEREALRGYIRTAFEGRYDRQIADRKKDLERLKKSVTKLESDLQRREAAKERVVQLQLQSVQLAAEGLLELNELQGLQPGARGGGGYEEYGQMRMEKGFGN